MSGAGAQRTRIKLCEFESLDAAYAAARLQPDALGFHWFKRHDRTERLARFDGILKHVGAVPQRVLLTDLEETSLHEVLESLPFNSVQLYPDWPPSTIDHLRTTCRVTVMKVMSADWRENCAEDRDFLRTYETVVDAFLLDSSRAGGTGRIADWNHCARVVEMSARPVYLAGGLTPQNVEEAISSVRPYGVDVETGVSDRIPGGPLVKNIFKCKAFVEAVRRADALDAART